MMAAVQEVAESASSTLLPTVSSSLKKRIALNPWTSMRKITFETGISDRSVRRMPKDEPGFKPHKLQKF